MPCAPCIVSMSPPDYPSAWLRPRSACLGFARHDHCSSTTTFGLNFRVARHLGVNNGLAPHPATPPEARRFLSHLDDDLAFRTSTFDVGHSLFG